MVFAVRTRSLIVILKQFIECSIGILLLAVSFASFSQSYPVKPIRVVIPYPPGGVDNQVRLLMPSVEKYLGQPWIIDYRPGAGGQIGQEFVARSAPDGYTIFGTVCNSWIILPALRKQTPYDPIKDFTPIAMMLESISLIVAHPSLPANNIRELIDYARLNPGKLTYATSGIGGAQHLDAENIKRLAGLDFVHAPFQGFGPMIPALVGGQVPIGFITYSVAKGFISSGKWKLLGVTNTEANSRAMAPPGVQFVSDVLPGFEASPQWLGFGGPAGMSRPIVTRLHDAISRALSEQGIVEKYIDERQVNYGRVGIEEFERRIRDDFASVRKSVQNSGIPPQE